MTVAAFALILLSASYLWMRRWQLSRSHLLRSDGHALYFFVVAAAVPLGIWVGCSIKAVAHMANMPTLPHEFANATLGTLLADDRHRGEIALFGLVAIASLPLAPILAWILNRPIEACSALTARLLFRLGVIEEFEGFLWGVNERGLSVMATTTSGKVYVGNSLELPLKGAARKYIRLEPLLSGYRDEKQIFHPTTSYRWIAKLPRSLTSGENGLCRRDFDVLLPSETITSVHSFDLETFVARYSTHGAQNTVLAPTESDAPFEKGAPQLGDRFKPELRNPTTLTEWFYLLFVVAVFATPVAFSHASIWLGVFLIFIGVLVGSAAAIEPLRRFVRARLGRPTATD